MKFNRVTNYLFKSQIVWVLEMYAWALVILAAVPLLIDLISGTFSLSKISINSVLSFPISAIFQVFLIFIAMLSYSKFKILIQNGISRATFFWSQMVVIGIFAIIGDVIELLVGYLSREKSFNIFTSAYADFFHNIFATVGTNFIFSALTSLSLIGLAMAFSSFVSLFTRRIQIFIVISIPVILIVGLSFVSRPAIATALNASWIGNFGKLILGYNATEAYNPFFPMIFMVIWIIVCGAITKFFFSRKQIKR